ncbi:MAG: cell envelope integrity EipB family protein [Pseudomonadota bacterium]|nr:cell envelope integrity EipB family protein [Pseudomonadota bacterium]
MLPFSRLSRVLLATLLVLSCNPDTPDYSPLVPHRAEYRLSLESARNGSMVTGVSGTMTYELQNSCDGWITQQVFDIRFLQADGEEISTRNEYNGWESKDADLYRFNVRKATNGEADEALAGSASPGRRHSMTARFTRPEARQIDMEGDILFPTQHTALLLEAAQKGEQLFTGKVFDGSDTAGETEISAWISPPRTDPVVETTSPLVSNRKYWPVRFAFFPASSTQAVPDYEATTRVYDNGVWGNMVFDYGTFQVRATLEKLEQIRGPACP